MKKKSIDTRSEQIELADGILETNNAHEEVAVEEKPKATPEERQKIKSFIITSGVSLLIVVAVLVVGVIFGNMSQQKNAAREPRESTPTFYGALEEQKEDDITSAITEAYYTASNGMMVTIEFGNTKQTDQHISKVVVAIYTEKDVEIAKAQSASMKADFVVPAGGTNEIVMYIEPDFVSITDDPLETLKYEITIDYETRE